MSKLIDRFEDAISGVIHGFDRIVFQGFIRPIVFPEGAMNFFDSKGILYKDAKPWMETQTERLVTRIDDMSIKATGLGIIPIKNKDLRELRSSSKQFKGKDEKQISGFVTRVIRLMRDHKLIRKYPKQHKYQLNNDGRKLALLIDAAMSASTQKLSDIAA